MFVSLLFFPRSNQLGWMSQCNNWSAIFTVHVPQPSHSVSRLCDHLLPQRRYDKKCCNVAFSMKKFNYDMQTPPTNTNLVVHNCPSVIFLQLFACGTGRYPRKMLQFEVRPLSTVQNRWSPLRETAMYILRIMWTTEDTSTYRLNPGA